MTKVSFLAMVVVIAFGTQASGQTPIGPNLQVNTYTAGQQAGPSIGVEPDGDFVVVWMSENQDGSGTGVFGQRFDASGVARGGEFQVSVETLGHQNSPDVAVGSAGDFVVVWASEQNGLPGPIKGRLFDASGDPLGQELAISSNAASDSLPRVARASDGRFVVAWTSPASDGDGTGISARRFDAAGSPAGDEFVANTTTSADQWLGEIASDASGNFVAVWWSPNAASPHLGAVAGRKFDGSGQPVGTEFQVGGGWEKDPAVSISPTGDFVVAWTSTWWDNYYGYLANVIAHRFDSAGQSIGISFVVAGTAYNPPVYGEPNPAIAHQDAGTFVVTYMLPDGYATGVLGRRFHQNGANLGGEFRVNTYTLGWETSAVVGSSSDGGFVVTWSDDRLDGDNGGVFAQRFVPDSADIAVAITDSPDPVPPGAALVYTITVTNQGPTPSPGLQVTMPTPSGLSFVSSTGACATGFPCLLGTVPAGEARTITATYKVPRKFAGTNAIVANVAVTVTPIDPDPANNQATAQTTFGPF